MTSITELVAAFYSIAGETVQEKRKHFNKYLEILKLNLTNPDEIIRFVNNISPHSVLEQTLKIEIMIIFQQYDILLNGIKSGDLLLISKVLKNWHLFRRVFENVSPHDFVYNTLPQLSYSLKLKLLNGIRKNINDENILDQYYTAVENKYGLKVAMVLLPGCSMDLIRLTVEKYYIKFTNKQLLHIIKKNHSFIEFYFNILEIRNGTIKFKDYLFVLKYLAKVDTALYWKLYNKYKVCYKFGKRLTRKMFLSKEIEVEDFEIRNWTFHTQMVFRTMRKENKLHKFLIKLSPENHMNFTETVFNFQMEEALKKCLPEYMQYQVITSIFHEKYGLNLLDYPKYCPEEFMTTIPHELRENIVNALVKENDRLIYLYRPLKAISILKEKVKHTSEVNERAYLVRQMYKTCRINRNNEALLEVLEYTLNRHQNETNLIGMLLNYITQWPHVEQYDNRYWKYFEQMAKILLFGGKEFQGNDFFVKHVYHLIEYNLPHEEACMEYIKNIFRNISPASWSFFIESKKYERKYIEIMSKCIKSCKDHPQYNSLCISFIGYLNIYNSHKKNIPISLHECEYNYLAEEAVTIDDYWTLVRIILLGFKNDKDELWLDIIWKHEKLINCDILLWCIRRNPEKIRENLEIVVNRLSNIKRVEHFFKNAKLYSNDIIKEINDHVLKIFYSGNYEKATRAIKIINNIAPESFIESVKLLLPNIEVDVNIKKSKEELLFQKTVIRNLHKVPNSKKAFSLISQYSKNKYLISILPCLNIFVYITPENEIKDYLLTLSSSKSVSIRKNVLILARHLFATKDFINLLESECKKENNVSIKSTLLKKIIQKLIDSPIDTLWFLFNDHLKLINKDDVNIYNFMLKFNKIPLEYLPSYIEVIFDEVTSNPNKEINKNKYEILASIPDTTISTINVSFLKKIISKTATPENTSNFHWKCVFYVDKNIRDDLFEYNFSVLKKFIEENPPNITRNIKSRIIIKDFSNRFLNIILDLKRDYDLLQKFLLTWSTIFNPNELNLNFILIEFTDLYFRSNFDASQFGIKINELLNEYVKVHDYGIVDYFNQQLDQFLGQAKINEDHKFAFINGFFSSKTHVSAYAVTTHVLPKHIPNACSKYLPIFTEIETCNSPAVQYHFDGHLKNCMLYVM